MFRLISNNQILKNICTIIFIVIMTAFLIFGAHILLNLGRFLGTIARYVAEGNICF